MKLMSLSKTIAFSVFALCAVDSATYAKENSIEKIALRSSAKIRSVTMALGVEGEEAKPVNTTNVFKPTDTIHAVVKVANAPADTKVGATWVAVDVGDAAEPDSVILSFDIAVEGTRNIDFSLVPSKPFPVGTYQVEISVDGTLDSTKKFTIKE